MMTGRRRKFDGELFVNRSHTTIKFKMGYYLFLHFFLF